MKEEDAQNFYYWFRSAGVRCELLAEDGEYGVCIWVLDEGGTLRPSHLWNPPVSGNRQIVQIRERLATNETPS